MFSSDCFQNIPLIYKELQRRSLKRMNKVIMRSYLIVLSLFFGIALFGYFSTIWDVPEILLFRHRKDGVDPAYDWPMVLARVLMCIILTIATPLMVYPTRLSIEYFFFGGSKRKSIAIHTVLTIVILATVATLAIVFPSVIGYFNILGGFFTPLMAVLLPMSVY